MKRKKKKQDKQRTKRRPIPDPTTVVSQSELTSPRGRVYRIIRTTQTDPYDVPTRPKHED